MPHNRSFVTRIILPLLFAGLLLPCLDTEAAAAAVAHGRLGRVLNTQDGDQIFGFDINQHGNDGVLATARTLRADGTTRISVQTFDQNTGQITSAFVHEVSKIHSYSVDGILAGDVGLLTHFVVPPGSIFAQRVYETMNPVTANMFTGMWTPPVRDIDIEGVGINQASRTAAFFVIGLRNGSRPAVFASDVAANRFGPVFQLDRGKFGVGNSPKFAIYSAKNQAVFALSPDGGAVGGRAPLIIQVDLRTGQQSQFDGLNLGFFHAGYVNGLAVDPNTGVAATTTELNSQVEFYDLNRRLLINFAQLPCTSDTDQVHSGSGIAVDPIHRVFLVTEQFVCGSSAGAIHIYDERGNLVETVSPFKFGISEPAPAINPSKRMGWAFGGPGGANQLQQFFY